jgi:hypothetical protein
MTPVPPAEIATDDEAHLAALLAVLALVRADAERHPSANGTPLQEWRARRLAALAPEYGTSRTLPSALPRRAGQRRTS